MFKVGDLLNYGFYVGIKIVGEDEQHFILQDKNGNQKKVVKRLVNKHGKLISRYK